MCLCMLECRFKKKEKKIAITKMHSSVKLQTPFKYEQYRYNAEANASRIFIFLR